LFLRFVLDIFASSTSTT